MAVAGIKITEYPDTHTGLPTADSWFDISTDDGGGQKSKGWQWGNFLSTMQSNIDTIYNSDGVLGGARIVDLDTNDILFANGGVFNIDSGTSIFNSPDVAFRTFNSRGNTLAISKGSGLKLNDFNNALGAEGGFQEFESYFEEYTIAWAKNAAVQSAKEFLTIDRMNINSQPFSKIGVNCRNNTFDTLIRIELDKNGPAQAASPKMIDLIDDYGAHNVDLGGSDFFKTGIKISFTNAFTTTTTGSGVVRPLWLNAVGGDINQALFVENGLIVSPNMPTSSAGLPVGALWNNSGVINIV
jgi:hypothetical protein